jgi:hypothetical protein
MSYCGRLICSTPIPKNEEVTFYTNHTNKSSFHKPELAYLQIFLYLCRVKMRITAKIPYKMASIKTKYKREAIDYASRLL